MMGRLLLSHDRPPARAHLPRGERGGQKAAKLWGTAQVKQGKGAWKFLYRVLTTEGNIQVALRVGKGKDPVLGKERR